MQRPTVTKPALMPGGSDARFRAFIHDLLAFSAQVDQVRDGFGAHIGLSGTAYTLLKTLRHVEDGEGVGVNRLAEHLSLSGAFVTIEIAKLVEAGLVEKRRNPRDRRRVLLTVTPEGDALLERLLPIQAAVNDLMFGAFDEAEFLRFADMLETLLRSGREAVTLLTRMATKPEPAAPTRNETAAAQDLASLQPS